MNKMANEAGNLFKQLKQVVCGYYRDGKMLDNPVGVTGRQIGDDEEINNFFKRLVWLLMNTSMTCEETKVYLSDMYITYKGVADRIAEVTGRTPNVNTLQTKTYYDKMKVIKYFGDTFILDLVYMKDKKNLPYLNERLDMAYTKFSSSNLLGDKLAVKLPEVTEAVTQLDDATFSEFLHVIAPYTRAQMQFIHDNVDLKAVAYCHYLLNARELPSSKDEENRQILLDMLS